jgi:hypothetical protein
MVCVYWVILFKVIGRGGVKKCGRERRVNCKKKCKNFFNDLKIYAERVFEE